MKVCALRKPTRSHEGIGGHSVGPIRGVICAMRSGRGAFRSAVRFHVWSGYDARLIEDLDEQSRSGRNACDPRLAGGKERTANLR